MVASLSGLTRILYCYPQNIVSSFTLVARAHVKWVKRLGLARVDEVNSAALPNIYPAWRSPLVLHPAVFLINDTLEKLRPVVVPWREEYWEAWKSRFTKLIGVDVADSDVLSDLAVSLLNRLDLLIMPSRFSKGVAERCGVSVPVKVVHHGLDPEYYTTPSVWDAAPTSALSTALLDVYTYKAKTRVKYLLFWMWHSPERKGWPEVAEVYRKLKRERGDIMLVVKTSVPEPHELQAVKPLGLINVHGWLTELEKVALYDLADVTLMFSRGGSFEMNALESLARGTPCVTSDWGPWTEYVPPFLQVPRGRRVKVLLNSLIHTGYGYTVDVEKAVDKLHHILDNLDEYRARTQEWREKVLAPEYRWDVVARRLVSALSE